MQSFHDLFNAEQLSTIRDADLIMGHRHPTWCPLFYTDRVRAIDHLTQEAVPLIARQAGGEGWLKDLVPRLVDFQDIRNASSSLAEIRAYAGLLNSGFSVAPIDRSDDSTPDFVVDAGDGPIIVEVFAKHQDEAEDELLDAVHSSGSVNRSDVTRRSATVGGYTITTTICPITPGGRPDPNKTHDSVQANVISRVCSMKGNEKQIPDDRPALLIADFTHFGPPGAAELLHSTQASPLLRGHHGIACGAMWYGMYGWNGAPVFEEQAHHLVRMAHDGRFRQTGKRKSKLSAALLVFHKAVVLLENPWALNRLPNAARMALCRYPWFDLVNSIGDWQPGDAEKLVALQRSMIEVFERQHEANPLL
ncbi:hypothetical protein [Ralstonia solanacearum]|uniref:hypothetical protein n=1 Tax=Ralstonia solanacearum TaxID=305 RepID=UPI0001D952D3|nr:hypothetical protein [Ralstonia solanacearum]CBJ50357.1 hypothethical protein [Ralstonia solanacearum PSI07]